MIRLGRAAAFKDIGLGFVLEIVKKIQGNQRIRCHLPPLGRQADLRLNIALPAFGEGLRVELGDIAGVGSAGRVQPYDSLNRESRNMLKKIRIMNFSSYSLTDFLDWGTVAPLSSDSKTQNPPSISAATGIHLPRNLTVSIRMKARLIALEIRQTLKSGFGLRNGP